MSLNYLCRRSVLATTGRRWMSEYLPRPPPPTGPPHVTTLSDTSRPRPYPRSARELPGIERTWPAFLGISVIAIISGGAFYFYVTNQEKASSSIMGSIIRTIRQDPLAQELLGDVIRPEPKWFLNGDPVIRGQVKTLQGLVDLSFRVKGTKEAGTVYFTSIRRVKGTQFEILRFKLRSDDGIVVNIMPDVEIDKGHAETMEKQFKRTQ